MGRSLCDECQALRIALNRHDSRPRFAIAPHRRCRSLERSYSADRNPSCPTIRPSPISRAATDFHPFDEANHGCIERCVVENASHGRPRLPRLPDPHASPGLRCASVALEKATEALRDTHGHWTSVDHLRGAVTSPELAHTGVIKIGVRMEIRQHGRMGRAVHRPACGALLPVMACPGRGCPVNLPTPWQGAYAPGNLARATEVTTLHDFLRPDYR